MDQSDVATPLDADHALSSQPGTTRYGRRVSCQTGEERHLETGLLASVVKLQRQLIKRYTKTRALSQIPGISRGASMLLDDVCVWK